MKNILSIAVVCLLGTSQAIQLTAGSQVEAQVEVEAKGCGSGVGCACLQHQKPRVDPCCVNCDPCVCTSADCDFSTGQDKSLITYAGVTSLKESSFWQIIKTDRRAMREYQKYVKRINWL
jgi:hypothetical protein